MPVLHGYIMARNRDEMEADVHIFKYGFFPPSGYVMEILGMSSQKPVEIIYSLEAASTKRVINHYIDQSTQGRE
jgi:hypothetical protein